MKTVVLDIRSVEETLADTVDVMKTRQGDQYDRISFATPELLWKVLTAKR